MLIDFYQTLADALRSQAVVVATVINIKGSVPREVGAKMLIGCDWIYDTIGGGAGEAKMIEQGRSLLATKAKQQATIDLTGDVQQLKEGICGGYMCLWLETWSGSAAFDLAQQIVETLKQGQRIQLQTPFTPTQSPSLIQNFATTEKATVEQLQLSGSGFIEMLAPPPLLLIVGAGHVGEALAKVAYLAGFQIAIQDERSEFANRSKYPQASLILATNIDEALAKVRHYQELFVALVTRGYPFDLGALINIVKQQINCRYIGMIGSKKRVNMVMHSLREQGFSNGQLNGIHAPIGLEIGALTPSEIAVSICAELIAVRRFTSARLAVGTKHG